MLDLGNLTPRSADKEPHASPSHVRLLLRE
jgi:hypothetical protein